MLAALFILLTGLTWMAISASQASSRHGNCPPELFFGIGATCTFLLTLALIPLTGAHHGLEWSWLVVLCTIGAAALNSIANITTMLNVGYGSAALYLALSSLGIIISFLWSVAVWHEPMSLRNAVGIACIVAAIVLSALDGRKREKAPAHRSGDLRLVRKRLALALASTLACGASQILFIYPFSTKFPAPPLPSLVKISLISASYIVIYGAIILCRRKHYAAWPSRRLLATYPVLWGILAVVSYTFLFTALKYLGEMGRSGLAYPLCSAVQLFCFALFCRVAYHDRLTPRQAAALLLIVVGIFAARM